MKVENGEILITLSYKEAEMLTAFLSIVGNNPTGLAHSFIATLVERLRGKLKSDEASFDRFFSLMGNGVVIGK